MIHITANTRAGERLLRRLAASMAPKELDPVVRLVATESLAALIAKTPIGFTKNTRKQWVRVKLADASYEVINRSKVAWFLEHGTKAHGPVRAKVLFIPLTKKAVQAGPAGVMAANRGAGAEGARKPFRYGRDFVFAKRVKGIRARRIVSGWEPYAKRRMMQAGTLHLRNAIRSAAGAR